MRRVLELLGLSLLTGASLLIATMAVAEKKPSKPLANDWIVNDIKIGNESNVVQGRTAPPPGKPVAGKPQAASSNPGQEPKSVMQGSAQITGRPQVLVFKVGRPVISSESLPPSNQDSSTNSGAVDAPAPTQAARDILPMSTGVPTTPPK